MKYLGHIFAAACVSLTACAVTTPSHLIVAPTEIVEKKVVVPTTCLREVPAFPDLKPMPESGIADQTIVRVEREKELREYADRVKAILEACTEEK